MTKLEFIGNAVSEFAPITTFVVLSEVEGFTVGLEALLVASLLAFFLSWFIERRVPKFGLFAATTILLFGTLSIVLNDPFYIIIKDTLYYAIFGLVLLVGLFSGHSAFKMFFGDFFAMSERGWRTLSLRWGIFFLLLAVGNEIARHLLTPDGWVLYKFIALPVMWVFGFYQFTLICRERLPDTNKWGLRMRGR